MTRKMVRPEIVRTPERFNGMSCDERENLIIELTRDCPSLIFDYQTLQRRDLVALIIQYGPGGTDWVHVGRADTCMNPGPLRPYLEKAREYAESRKRNDPTQARP